MPARGANHLFLFIMPDNNPNREDQELVTCVPISTASASVVA